ncbi:hypothetical protein L6R52_35885 [Myxococcota bacterium]|nr:hypothetical protein [Myxococcota bacterium]
MERLRAANVTRVAIIVDACDAPAGKLTSQSKGTPVDAEATRTDRRWSTERFARLERSALILESASSQQPAQEVAAFENSVYTYFLKRALGPDVEAVRRASFPGLPVSLFGAHVWASLRVSEYTGGAQTPSWSGPDANVGSGLFLLEDHRAPSRTSDATLIRLGEPSAPGLRMRVRALVSAMMKGTSTTTTSGWEAIVETAGVHVPAPGRYEVSFESPDGELASSREVDLEMGTTNTIYPFVELAGRGTERISVDVGASIPLAEWGRPGATLGAGARVSHGVDDTPIDGLVGDLSLELSVGARRHPEAPDLQQRDVLLLMGAGLAVDGQLGAARLGLGPELLVGGLRRELDALGRADYHAVVGIGLRPWAWFRVSTHFGLELAVHARALALGSVETGALFLGATAGVALDRPTTRVRPEAR